MKDEATLWFKATREEEARNILMRKYRTGLFIFCKTLTVGVILSTPMTLIGLGELATYMILFFIFALVYNLRQISRLRKIN